MIVALEGIVEKKQPTVIHLNVNGVTYEIFISINTYHDIDSQRVKLLIVEIIREDAHTLYGFSSESQKEMFLQLIKINGVGPKVALAICSTYSPSSFYNIVQANDVGSLKKVPGIGPKGASRILVELSNFVVSSEDESQNPSSAQATMALESLGFKKENILKVLSTIKIDDTQQIIKEALKRLK